MVPPCRRCAVPSQRRLGRRLLRGRWVPSQPGGSRRSQRQVAGPSLPALALALRRSGTTTLGRSTSLSYLRTRAGGEGPGR